MIDEQLCPKCGCIDWDHANVGLIGAVICTDCGEIYMMEDKTMTNDQTIIDDALEQIVLDVKQGDLTAIEEMLRFLPKNVLVSFVSCCDVGE